MKIAIGICLGGAEVRESCTFQPDASIFFGKSLYYGPVRSYAAMPLLLA